MTMPRRLPGNGFSAENGYTHSEESRLVCEEARNAIEATRLLLEEIAASRLARCARSPE